MFLNPLQGYIRPDYWKMIVPVILPIPPENLLRKQWVSNGSTASI